MAVRDFQQVTLDLFDLIEEATGAPIEQSRFFVGQDPALAFTIPLAAVVDLDVQVPEGLARRTLEVSGEVEQLLADDPEELADLRTFRRRFEEHIARPTAAETG